MIERFSVNATPQQLASRFDTEEPIDFKPRYNVAPTQLLPVITHQTPQGFSYFYWGIAPQWSKNKTIAEKIINVHAEQIVEKPMFKKNLVQHRCLIPADGFYAWKKVGKKTSIPWRFALRSKEIVSFAALWEEYNDVEGNGVHTFTLITTVANELVKNVAERMPLIFTKESEQIWLKKDAVDEELTSLMTPFPAAEMDGYTVSPQLNNLAFDRPSLLIPTPPADQFGNLTLFD